MSEVKIISKNILSMMDRIIRNKVQNSLIIGLYDRIILPFFVKQIDNTSDVELQKNLQFAYDQLKPHFEKKQLKEQIDEGNKLSGFKLLDHGLLEKESRYF